MDNNNSNYDQKQRSFLLLQEGYDKKYLSSSVYVFAQVKKRSVNGLKRRKNGVKR